METLPHANTFFLISSIGFVIVFILIAIALIYLISVFKRVNGLAKHVEENAESISEDAREFILDIRNSPVLKFLFGRKRARKSIHGK